MGLTKHVHRLARGLFAAFGMEVHRKHNRVSNSATEYLDWNRRLWMSLRSQAPGTIIDVGAHDGQFAEMVRSVYPDARIISFEPLPSCFERLRQVCVRIGNAECHNCALGDTPGEARMFLSSFPPSSSMLAMGELHKREWPMSADNATLTVALARLDDVVTPDLLPREIIIKIDVQGFEDRGIAGGRNVLGHARAAVIETSFFCLYEGQPLFDQIYEQMTSLGFRYHGALDTCRSREDGRILQEDALFIRPHGDAHPTESCLSPAPAV